MPSIVRDDAIRSGEPRLEGTRITVRDIKRREIDAEEDPHVVAGEYGISMAECFGALTQYSEHRDAFEDAERETERTRRDGERGNTEDRDGSDHVSGEEDFAFVVSWPGGVGVKRKFRD
ncbi:DUF433 domain-containing protein [Halorubrum sp. AS12]|uniref:DUF433 domain-containing protein n=1 Tax=Halorubrum sp. AS12 TaxID=3409687 RepID=UPI003DA7A350